MTDMRSIVKARYLILLVFLKDMIALLHFSFIDTGIQIIITGCFFFFNLMSPLHFSQRLLLLFVIHSLSGMSYLLSPSTKTTTFEQPLKRS